MEDEAVNPPRPAREVPGVGQLRAGRGPRDRALRDRGPASPLSQKYILGELETILLNASRGLDNQDVIDDIYRDVASHVLAIQQRMEIAAGDVLADGKLTLNGENGLTVEVDYQVPSANRPVASVPWTDPNADMLRDEMLWIEYLRSIGAPLPTRALTSYKAAALMAGNSSYRNAFYNPQGVNIPSAVLAPDQVQAVRARYGLPPITIYDLQLPAEAAWATSASCRRTCTSCCRRTAGSGRRPSTG